MIEQQKYCKNCGTRLKEGSSFCGKCGTAVEQKQKNIENESSKLTKPEKKQRNGKAIVTGALLIILLIVTGALGLSWFKENEQLKNMVTDTVVMLGEEPQSIDNALQETSDGEYIAVVKEGEKWFIINEQNEKTAEIPIENIEDVILQGDNLQFGLIEILTTDNKVAFVDIEGNIVLEPLYEWAEMYNRPETFRDYDGVGLCIIKEEGKYGVVNSEAKVILNPVYDDLAIYSNVIKVQLDNKYGVVDFQGRTILDFVYDDIDMYDIGMNPDEAGCIGTKLNNKYGFINMKEGIMIEPVYDDLSLLHVSWEGYIEVSLNGKYGLLNSKGELMTEIIYDEFLVPYAGEGLIKMVLNGKHGYMDYEGNILVEPIYEDAKRFCHGLAAVKINGKWGYIDQTGKIALEAVYGTAADFGANGWAAVSDWEHGYGYNFINKQGEIMMNIPYDWISGVGFVESGLVEFKDEGKWGCMNEQGDVIVAPMYDRVYVDVSEDELIKVEIDEKYGYMDRNGNVIVEPIYDWVEWFLCEGENCIVSLDGKDGLLNAMGEIILEPVYDSISKATEDSTRYICYLDGKAGLFSETGEVIVEPKYDEIYLGEYGLGIIVSDGKLGYINYDGDILMETEMELNGDRGEYLALQRYTWDAPYVSVEIDGKYGHINSDGEIVIEPQYDWATSFAKKR